MLVLAAAHVKDRLPHDQAAEPACSSACARSSTATGIRSRATGSRVPLRRALSALESGLTLVHPPPESARVRLGLGANGAQLARTAHAPVTPRLYRGVPSQRSSPVTGAGRSDAP